MAVVTFSNIKGGTSGTLTGITFLNSDYSLEFIESAVTDAVDSAMTGYTRTEDFATINGSAITEGGNIEIETGGNYSAGTNIDITDDVISVTGITVPTKVSDLENDEGFVDSGDVKTQIEDYGYITEDALSGYSTTEEVEGMVTAATSGLASTSYVDDAVSGKADSSAVTADIAAATAATTGWVENQGYLTAFTESDPVFMASPASGITDNDIENWNSVSGKADASAFSAYTPTSGMATINGSAITNGGNITVEETAYSGGTGIGVSEHIISVTGDYETVVELTQDEYDALTAYTDNTTYIITDAEAVNMSAYTPTSGFSTINGSAITNGGNITVEETPYSGGSNIAISGHVISVTGITVPTKVSDLQNDLNFVDSGQVQSQITAATEEFVTSGDVKTQIEDYGYATETYVDNSVSGKADTSALTEYYTSAQTDTAINNAVSGLASTTYVDNSVSGKADISSLSAYTTSADVETQITEKGYVTSGEVETQITDKGYITGYTETDPVFQASAASGISAQDISDWNNKLDASALTPYYTSAQTDTQIANAVSGKQDTLISGTNIKTINNQSLLGSGNIDIQGGGGSGESVVELTQLQYDALTAYSQNTTYIITDATEIDLNDYMKVPISGGSVNSILMNSGSQTPIWSTYKFQFISQADYNNLQTKDSTTIYFIV